MVTFAELTAQYCYSTQVLKVMKRRKGFGHVTAAYGLEASVAVATPARLPRLDMIPHVHRLPYLHPVFIPSM